MPARRRMLRGMGLLGRRKGSSETNGSHEGLSEAEADSLGLSTLVAQGLSGVQATTAIYSEWFGLDRADWGVDLNAGTITFTTPDRQAVAAVQIIGTYDPNAGSFMWGWDHPSVPENCAEAAQRVHAFGLRNNHVTLTSRVVECTESDAWEFTQLAVRLGPETCAYRGRAGGSLVFMAFGTVTVSAQ